MNDAFKGKYVKLTSRFLVGPVSYGKETLGHSPLLSRLAHLVMITCMQSLYNHAWPLGYCCHLSGHSNSKLSTLGETLGHFPPPSSCSGTSMGQLGQSWWIFCRSRNPECSATVGVINDYRTSFNLFGWDEDVQRTTSWYNYLCRLCCSNCYLSRIK